MIRCPGAGTVLKVPNWVHKMFVPTVCTVGHVVAEKRAGRSFKMEVPSKSSGMVMLNGISELMSINGFSRKPMGSVMVPPKKARH